MSRELAAYLRERFDPRIFGPAIALLACAGVWSAGALPGPAGCGARAGLTTLLVLQFRLWDDLEDRERDRQEHPGRLLTRTAPAPFVAVLVFLAVTNVALLALSRSPAAVVGLILLDAFLWLAYRGFRTRLSGRVWRFGILQIKYPSFAALVALTIRPAAPLRLAVAAAAIYLCACAYETLHERHSFLGATS